MILDYEVVPRAIHYYELDTVFNDEFQPDDDDQFREFFHIITKLAHTKDKLRYQIFGDRSIFIQDIKFQPVDKKIVGKLRCIRKDILPEIMNTTTDVAKGIEVEDEEGIVETTHFVIDYAKTKKKLAIEFNLYGAKIPDFLNYCLKIGEHHNVLKELTCTPIIKDELAKFKDRIKSISQFVVKVHKDNIEQIESLDGHLHSALKASISQFRPEYATLDLKFDYRLQPDAKEMKKSIFNLITKLSKQKTKVELFNTLRVRAENAENNLKMEVFDLLINKVRSDIKVQKKAKYRTIITADIIEKMKKEMLRKKI